MYTIYYYTVYEAALHAVRCGKHSVTGERLRLRSGKSDCWLVVRVCVRVR